MNKKKLSSTLWVLAFFWIVFIFSLSTQNGEETAKASGGIAQSIANVFFAEATKKQIHEVHYLVRKMAHIVLFLVLGMILALAGMWTGRASFRYKIPFVLTTIYGVLDEWIKQFIDGRHVQLEEVLLNIVSGVLGIVIILQITRRKKMTTYHIENKHIKVHVNSFGGEMSRIYHKENKKEYLWNADENYWKRSSPILFPFVGGLKEKSYTYDGVRYPMSQHGFARDMEFELIQKEKKKIKFALESDDETMTKYPFKFLLEQEYILEEERVRVIWRVFNQDQKTMYFSIGGHPAFRCPLDQKGQQRDYKLDFHTEKDLLLSTIDLETGLVNGEKTFPLKEGKCNIEEDLFSGDALVIENNQTQRISLIKPTGETYLSVDFDAPLVGVWSPPGKKAPFVCIEPWYGRCDHMDFKGDLSQRAYTNTLEPGQCFEASYSIRVF